MINLSPVAQAFYGFTSVSEEAITNYGYALLTIAGGDQEISKAERQWFETYFVELLFIPDEIAAKYKSFDFLNADLDAILPQVKFETDLDPSLLLIYDSIRMSKADNDFQQKEKELVTRAGEMLGVPAYKIKAIESLVDSEISLITLRKGIFEVDKSKTPQKSMPTEGVIKHNSWVTMNFGHSYTTFNSLKSYCELLLVVSGADGEVSEPEMIWLEMTALAAGTPQEIIDGLRSFDYSSTTVEELLPNLVTDTYQNLDRISIYLAMHMAAADGVYAEDEHQELLNAAGLLKVESEVVDYLEKIVEVERATDALKYRLLAQ